ncbi:MAG: alpha/beta hydrolase [Patescibacteria group bacterium]|nr:alpha/beta hydrolase [Patescibacteria group bacterium]
MITNKQIIILHGWRLYSSKYSLLVKFLEAKNNKVYVPDLPGFGKSSKVERPYRLDDYVDFLSLYIKQHKIKNPIIIGHSFGGRVALKYCAKYPKYASYLILTGVPGFIPVNRYKIYFFYIISKIGGVVFRIPMLCKIQSIARKLLYRMAGASDYMHTDGYMRDTFKSVIREDLLLPMKNLRIPTILVWGGSDSIVPLSVAAQMNKTISGSKMVVVKNASHRLPYESPNDFLDKLSGYIK